MTKTIKLMCIDAAQPHEERVAVITNQALSSIETQEHEQNRSCGNIYLGTISSIQTGIDAVFVDFGSQRHGFLPFKEIAAQYYQAEQTPESKIGDLVKVGQKVLVQVSREEKQNKGAALTTFLSLAGAYLVIMSNNQKNNGISKKADVKERQKIKEMLSQLAIPEQLSVIVRTEGLNRCKEELAWDLECLIHHWENIHKASQGAEAPALIHQEADALIRSVRDRLRKNIDQIVVNDQSTFDKLKVYLELTRPEFAEKLNLYQNKVPIFAHFGIQSQINSLFMRKIQLPSGGSIVIDYSEAMTVIDVNSSKSTGAKNIEETAFQTNKEAAEEVLKQITLREIGGIIAVDFIDMTSSENKQKIEETVGNLIAKEHAKIRFEPISALTGCMFLSRQRTGPSIIDQHYTECQASSTGGLKRTVHSIANSILQKCEENAASTNGQTIMIQASDDVACFILNEKRNYVSNIESSYNAKLIVVGNNTYNDGKYTIKRTADDTNTANSYQQREEGSTNIPKWSQQSTQNTPLVPQNLYKEHPKQESVIQRFMSKILPPKTSETPVYNSAKPSEKKKETPSRAKNPRRRSRQPNQNRRGPQRTSPRGKTGNRGQPKPNAPVDRLED